MTDIVERLLAWANPVEQGYEVPAAGQAMRDGADEIERLRKALIKVCDRAHKVQVGCPSESFDIAIKEAKLMLNDTMPLAPFPNEPPFPSTADRR